MIGLALMIVGPLIGIVGYPAGMIAWKPGYAFLSAIAGGVMFFIGLGMLLGGGQ